MLVPYSKAHEVCLNLSHTHLLLPIPLHITPTFTTDLGESTVTEAQSLAIALMSFHTGEEKAWNSTLHISRIWFVSQTTFASTVSLQWHLHFEFVTSVTEVKGPSPLDNSKDQLEWRAPTSLDIETMVWDLPITILPTTPSQVAQAICMPAQHTLPL